MIDYNFIKELEGIELRAYVPKDKDGNIIGQSGVTIASGIDLGNFGDLDKLDIPESLQNKLEQYVGFRRDLAEQILEDNPLVLSKEEVDTLNKAIIKYHTKYIRDLYERDSKYSWDDLDDALKTIILSVLYQYGSPNRTPNFWMHVVRNDIDSVINELRNFEDSFPIRRNREADYLENNYA